jgi:hypothetical protein
LRGPEGAGAGWAFGGWRLFGDLAPASSTVSLLRFGHDLLGEALTVEVGSQHAIGTLVHFHPGLGISRPAGGQSRDIDDVLAEANGVVVLDHTPVLEAEELVGRLSVGHSTQTGSGS